MKSPAPHSSLLTPHSSLLTPHSSLLTPHSSLLTPHSSLLTPHSSPLTPHPSPLTPHPSPSAIRVSGLGKEYIIGGREKGNETFREMLTGSLVAPFRRWRKLGGEAAPEERFWALKDVSFEVQRGEVVGIIGRNGAGKSTLLKILSRITEPTEGEVEIRGRVASLLEVGTGFHPELTGRENIYLNGAILGMSRAEIGRKFDEIVAFAEIEKFLDTPVKRYSSGMYVRLAFAVAAHLESEILIVDEVLAVGDIGFQKKCLGKMGEISSDGRTVLFVSHNLYSLRTLCTHGILFKSGIIEKIGDAASVIEAYTDAVFEKRNESLIERNDRNGNGAARIIGLQALGVSTQPIVSGSALIYELEIICKSSINSPLLYMGFFDRNDNEIVHIHSHMNGTLIPELKGRHKIWLEIPRLSLTPGTYRVDVGILDGNEIADLVRGADILNVLFGDFFNSGYKGNLKGSLLLDHQWRIVS